MANVEGAGSVSSSVIGEKLKAASANLKKRQAESIDTNMISSLLNTKISSKIKFDGSTRLFGQPFQFDDKTDFRIDEIEGLGRKYTETILAESPIVYFLPGRASYLPELSEDERNSIVQFFDSAVGKASKNIKDDILGSESRYFDFVADYNTYMQYVNVMCRVAAVYMGLGDMTMDGVRAIKVKYRNFDWKNYKFFEVYKPTHGKQQVFDMDKPLSSILDSASNMVSNWLGSYQYVQFYVDPSTSFQESSSNQSGTSAIQGMLDKIQSFTKETAFFAESVGAGGVVDTMRSMTDTMSNIANTVSTGILSKFMTNTKVLVDGGNILFPEIWGDASYSKSYNVTVHLVSPYGDKESVYLHVIVPLMHLMALALPRQMTANAFGTPFLVKVSCKGWFNCDLGMVDSISIEKAQDSYTVDGLATEIKVNLSIKDLYATQMITPSSRPGLFFENKGLINWLAITCGVNIAEPAMTEKWKAVFHALLESAVYDIPDNVYQPMIESLRNRIQPIIGF